MGAHNGDMDIYIPPTVYTSYGIQLAVSHAPPYNVWCNVCATNDERGHDMRHETT